MPGPNEEMFVENVFPRPHGRHSQQQPDIVIAGQDANTGAQFDQTMDGPQKIETTWTLVETIPANNEHGFLADMSEFEIPGSGACFPDPSGSGQGSREGFRIPMQVGKKEMSAFWPTPTALPIQMIQDIDQAFGTVAILGDGPRPAAAPILNLPRQSRGRPVPAPIWGTSGDGFALTMLYSQSTVRSAFPRTFHSPATRVQVPSPDASMATGTP